MTEYAILLPGDESRWAAATEEQRTATYARHGEFAAALAARGHTITGGAELTHSKEASVVRGAAVPGEEAADVACETTGAGATTAGAPGAAMTGPPSARTAGCRSSSAP